MTRYSRRTLLKAGAAFAGVSAIGSPAIVSAQAARIKIGHLAPADRLPRRARLPTRSSACVIWPRKRSTRPAVWWTSRSTSCWKISSVNPATAATKAQRMLEQDGAVFADGRDPRPHRRRPSCRSPQRNKKLFMQTGARSDALRGKNCSKLHLPRRHPEHRDGQRGRQGAAARQHGEGQEVLHADRRLYVRPRPAARRKGLLRRRIDGNLIGDELVGTDVTDFSPYLPEGRARQSPDVRVLQPRRQPGDEPRSSNTPSSACRIRSSASTSNTCGRLGDGRRTLSGTWPTVWHHTLDVPASKKFVEDFTDEARQAAGEPRLDRICLAAR